MSRNTGVPMQAKSLGGGLFGGLLYRMAQKLPPTERVKRPVKEKSPESKSARLLIEQADRAVEREQLADAILLAWRSGQSMKQIATILDVKRSHVYYVIRKHAKARA